MESASKAIKHAWIAAVVSGCLTLLAALAAIVSGGSLFGAPWDGWVLIDALLILGLAYGIYRKNRAAAVAMLLYFTLSQIWMRIDGVGSSGVMLAFFFFFFYLRGAVGTFAYEKLTRVAPAESAA